MCSTFLLEVSTLSTRNSKWKDRDISTFCYWVTKFVEKERVLSPVLNSFLSGSAANCLCKPFLTCLKLTRKKNEMEDLKRMKTVSLKIHSVLKIFTFTLHYSNTILMHIAHVEKNTFFLKMFNAEKTNLN